MRGDLRMKHTLFLHRLLYKPTHKEQCSNSQNAKIAGERDVSFLNQPPRLTTEPKIKNKKTKPFTFFIFILKIMNNNFADYIFIRE